VASTRARPVIAIDGPAGAGKSTIARKLADALGFVLVDTGALYRTIALAAKQAGIDWDAGPELGALARSIVEGGAMAFSPGPDGKARVLLSGEDVSGAIRAPDMGLGASRVSAHPDVRAALLDLQRHAGKDGGVVLEGRDIGTVVFPDAEVKFFLTARPDVRAKRRYDELVAKGDSVTYEVTLKEVLLRDDADRTRVHAPLRQAEDAVLVDSSEASPDEAVATMVAAVRSAQTRHARGA
jgi:cytidylate kinase